MPAKQIALLEQVAAANQNVVVVLSNGSVVSVAPWACLLYTSPSPRDS